MENIRERRKEKVLDEGEATEDEVLYKRGDLTKVYITLAGRSQHSSEGSRQTKKTG